MRTWIGLGVFVAVVLAVIGLWGDGRPSDREIHTLLLDSINPHEGFGLFEIEDFEVGSGHWASEDVFRAEVSYTRVVVRSIEDVEVALDARMKESGEAGELDPGDVIAAALAKMSLGMARTFQNLEVGARKDVEQVLTLERWDDGWRLGERTTTGRAGSHDPVIRPLELDDLANPQIRRMHGLPTFPGVR